MLVPSQFSTKKGVPTFQLQRHLRQSVAINKTKINTLNYKDASTFLL